MDTIEFDEIADQPCPIGWEFTRKGHFSGGWSHIWHPIDSTASEERCVILMVEDRRYYASPVRVDESIGPHDTLAEACAVADFLLR